MSNSSFLGGYKVEFNEAQKKLEKEYQRGANDTWKCIKKINYLDYKQMDEIFDVDCGGDWVFAFDRILKEYSPLEAISLIKKYELKESEKFHKGDEIITSDDYIGTITYVSQDGESVDIVWEDGTVSSNQDVEDIEKTGRRYKIVFNLDEDIKNET